MVLAALTAGTMCALSFFVGPEAKLSGELGVCLPSPNKWNIIPLVSWIVNTLLLGVIAVWAALLNRHYNFIRSTQPVLPALFLVLTASIPWLTDYLTASTLICLANILAITVLFSCHRQQNATQEMFLIATVFSVGSMVDYAFLPYMLAYIGGAIVMKAFRIKELLATLMGLVAPYWVGVGMGLISPEWFKLPEITNLFTDFVPGMELFGLMLAVGIAVFFGFILALNNSIKLYAGNSRINAQNLVIVFVMIVSVIGVVVDFSNMMAYLATLFFTVAAQVANLCALWKFRKEWLITFIPALIYVGFFIFFMLSGLNLL